LRRTSLVPTRIIVADDHAMFREMLRIALPRDGDLEVVGEAGDGLEVAALVERLKPDVVLLDYKMPHVKSFAGLVSQVLAHSPDTKPIVLSAFVSAEIATRAAEGGARGYVLKATRLAAVADAVRCVAKGAVWIDPGLPRRIFELFQRHASEGDARSESLGGLTRRERDVLAHVAKGISNPDIARQLCVSQQTVKTHLTRIYAKLEVRNRVGAALAFYGKDMAGAEDRS
jgi:DNA-binding NarL/FixJ family response regulator